MDRGTHEFVPRRSGSFGRASSANSSLRRQSSNLSFAIQHLVDDDVESESISEAGDIGDRALYSRRYSESGRHHFSFDNVTENGVVVPIQEDTAVNTDSPVSPSTLQTISPLSTDAIHPSKDKKKVSFLLLFLWFVVPVVWNIIVQLEHEGDGVGLFGDFYMKHFTRSFFWFFIIVKT